ncbi:MAG: gene transfer agent family protein [Pseudomonadota bacterium]
MSEHKANPLRGEVALRLGGTGYVLRPSFAALARIEEAEGSLLALIERASSGAPRLGDIVTVLWACLDAGGAGLSRDDVGELIAGDGVAAVTTAYRDILLAVLKGPA